ncbi:hypothetical protein DASC09_019160 [Saccharomycopsis crataegensis]|uniref:Uncharacterized protein n=1 Tax=Saccharomycopsis crataegensis TaxID=43959 RepID=A0AAV5QIZ8_9ASCO|nr:hypothetical protein DASC09_019160 [Saccharomycopsis crataegensis]
MGPKCFHICSIGIDFVTGFPEVEAGDGSRARYEAMLTVADHLINSCRFIPRRKDVTAKQLLRILWDNKLEQHLEGEKLLAQASLGRAKEL